MLYIYIYIYIYTYIYIYIYMYTTAREGLDLRKVAGPAGRQSLSSVPTVSSAAAYGAPRRY